MNIPKDDCSLVRICFRFRVFVIGLPSARIINGLRQINLSFEIRTLYTTPSEFFWSFARNRLLPRRATISYERSCNHLAQCNGNALTIIDFKYVCTRRRYIRDVNDGFNEMSYFHKLSIQININERNTICGRTG